MSDETEKTYTDAELIEIGKRFTETGDVKDNAGPERQVRLGMFLNLAKELRTQDNRATSYPMFVVRDRRWNRGDTRDAEKLIWTCNGSEVEDAALIAELDARSANRVFNDPISIDGEDYFREGISSTTEYVTTCITQAGADFYIEENRHNLHDPYVYVASGHRNREWQMLRRMLLKLGGEDFSNE